MIKISDIKFTKLGGDVKAQKLILQANIPFIILKKYAHFTYISEDIENEYYQRRINEGRIISIKKFIIDSILKEKQGNGIAVIFPTAMLLASQVEDEIISDKENYNWLDIFVTNDIPYFLIVDGQHRLRAMKELYDDVVDKTLNLFPDENTLYIKDYLENYRFNCTIMLNFDMWEQAQIFADVNFTQKKVSKDLYYSIYGMNPPTEPIDFKKNCIYIAHNLVKLLNTNSESPFEGIIRMLGSGNAGVISQSSMADAFIEQMRSPQGMWYIDTDKAVSSLRPMAVESISFFTAIKEIFADLWVQNGRHVSIICKTTGFGALVKLMRYIHIHKLSNYDRNELLYSETFLNKKYHDKIIELLRPLRHYEKELFSFDGQFAGTGGKGLVTKLFDSMVNLLENNNYSNSINAFFKPR